jgi:small subunit ribosomal protein S31
LEPFHDHVFLERHLEPWCPEKGPVRHFMELVCVGLQKNPYISLEKKLGHIQWFKDYFEDEDTKDILKLSGALEMQE